MDSPLGCWVRIYLSRINDPYCSRVLVVVVLALVDAAV
jgi:hypothetical protein